MGMYKRYSGEFLSRRGVTWRIEIWQEAEVQFPIVGELRFPADSPLNFEWAHTDKEEVICGSTATITIVSPGDRSYEDLYTIIPGSIRMDAYRNGILYWSGTLDPEFYEEPYSEAKEYEVLLTFSDFGILDRIKYHLSGIQTLYDIVEHCIALSGMNQHGIRQDYISTSLDENGAQLKLADLSIRSENFYDEDGEACTLYEALEGILKPLGLRMVQRMAQVWLYDLNGLYTLAGTKQVEWTDCDQVMSTDKVVNDVCITFSPYAKSELMDGEVKFEDEYSDETINLTSQAPTSGPECYTYYPDYEREWDYNNLSFTIFLSNQGSGLKEINSRCRYFHIEPLLGASEAEGVAWGFYTGGHGSLRSGWPKRKLNVPCEPDGTILMRTNQMPVHYLGSLDRGKYLIRLSMDLLIDARYNPFEDSNVNNESGNYDRLNVYANFVMVPVNVLLKDENGRVTYHYSNKDVVLRNDLTCSVNYQTKGEWVTGEPTEPKCWLSWYDKDDRRRRCGVFGWKTNNHAIGLTQEELKDSFRETPSGQYMPYPPSEGYLEVVVYSGIRVYDGHSLGATRTWDYVKDIIRWMLYKAPKLEVLKSNTVLSAAESEDVEYRGVLNENAKEDLEIDTICGTMERPIPTALGVYMKSNGKELVKEMSRAGRTTHAEQLLIGTLYSQYASRKPKLTGTVQLLNDVPLCYTEACQGEKRFICLEDIQDAIADESSMELVELRPDEYEEE